MRDTQSFPMNEETRLVPVWSMVAAGIAFAAVEYYWWAVVPAQRHHPPPPLGLRIYFDFSWGLLAALYFLMVGYVSRDAPRRSMSPRFWMMICALPGGIGAVLYFLLRLPITSRCAACGTHVQNDFHFCPQCAYQLTASCGNCFRSVRITDQFCTRCGHELAEDHMPARLRAIAD
jgi:hypothetical protein